MNVNYKSVSKSSVKCAQASMKIRFHQKLVRKLVLHLPSKVSVILSTTCARESQDLEEEGGTGRRREGGRDIVMEEGRPGGGAHPRPPKSRLGNVSVRMLKHTRRNKRW